MRGHALRWRTGGGSAAGAGSVQGRALASSASTSPTSPPLPAAAVAGALSSRRAYILKPVRVARLYPGCCPGRPLPLLDGSCLLVVSEDLCWKTQWGREMTHKPCVRCWYWAVMICAAAASRHCS
jgi:hypothetical protein